MPCWQAFPECKSGHLRYGSFDGEAKSWIIIDDQAAQAGKEATP
jgi:hypothetical protein